MRNFEIDRQTRKLVEERSCWECERCHKGIAVHMHHLTYERAGHELPEDLQHICILCHMSSHPKKAEEILDWEINRLAQKGRRRIYAWAQEQEEPEQEEPEQFEEEPALNLGNYSASGYCLEDVEREEMDRGLCG